MLCRHKVAHLVAIATDALVHIFVKSLIWGEGQCGQILSPWRPRALFPITWPPDHPLDSWDTRTTIFKTKVEMKSWQNQSLASAAAAAAVHYDVVKRLIGFGWDCRSWILMRPRGSLRTPPKCRDLCCYCAKVQHVWFSTIWWWFSTIWWLN